jgi:uncharacterized protein (TIGR00375 family)
LQQQLNENDQGVFSLPSDKAGFVLQTEVIFSTRLSDYKNKIIAHHIILFPHFSAIEKMNLLMQKWQMKNTIGRPFITSESQQQLADQLWEISNIDPLIELIPAHVMTPEGILGSRNNLTSLAEFYGDFLKRIKAVETGLSADPAMLEKIPDLASLTFISNSDCHSASLNRVGREFTVLQVEEKTYPEIIKALRSNKVILTAEFNPAEGRFYLTGHRGNRKDHERDIVYEKAVPRSMICPDCGRKMNLGVRERCRQLQNDSLRPLRRNFMHLIPLVEVISYSLGIRSINSIRVKNTFDKIMQFYQSEIELWRSSHVKELLDKWIDPKTINRILAVQEGRFHFDPPGFDGQYGNLIIGDHNG